MERCDTERRGARLAGADVTPSAIRRTYRSAGLLRASFTPGRLRHHAFPGAQIASPGRRPRFIHNSDGGRPSMSALASPVRSPSS